ncbi:patatin-like phospholipase family protein, partial [bacterium]|nr:patatin-like phospholipase family protein [bacterium]
MSERFSKFTLVFGGGGMRALAHIGVLEVLEEAAVPIGRIVATSAGAIIGAMYACKPDASDVRRKVSAFLDSETFKDIEELFQDTLQGTGGEIHSLPRLLLRVKRFLLAKKAAASPGVFETEVLHKIVDALLPNVQISECQIPFAAVAVDLKSGRPTVLNTGSLRNAVVASCAIPGFFPPQPFHGNIYIDGGTVSPVPVLEACGLSDSKEQIIAVDVGRDLESNVAISSALDVVIRNESIAGYWLKKPHLEKANVIIDPDVGQYTWSHAKEKNALVEAGAKAAREALPAIAKCREEIPAGILSRIF